MRKFKFAPIDAKIEINQKTYRSGDHRIEPGTYRLKIKREGFKSEEIDFTAEKGKTKYLYYCLTPDQDHQQWFKEHKRDQDICDQVDQALNDIERLCLILSFALLRTIATKSVSTLIANSTLIKPLLFAFVPSLVALTLRKFSTKMRLTT